MVSNDAKVKKSEMLETLIKDTAFLSDYINLYAVTKYLAEYKDLNLLHDNLSIYHKLSDRMSKGYYCIDAYSTGYRHYLNQGEYCNNDRPIEKIRFLGAVLQSILYEENSPEYIFSDIVRYRLETIDDFVYYLDRMELLNEKTCFDLINYICFLRDNVDKITEKLNNPEYADIKYICDYEIFGDVSISLNIHSLYPRLDDKQKVNIGARIAEMMKYGAYIKVITDKYSVTGAIAAKAFGDYNVTENVTSDPDTLDETHTIMLYNHGIVLPSAKFTNESGNLNIESLYSNNDESKSVCIYTKTSKYIPGGPFTLILDSK